MPERSIPLETLSRRERQIMDALYRRQRASAAEIQQDLPGEPSYSTVRALLRILEEKKCVEHDVEGQRYVYRPKGPLRAARRQAASTGRSGQANWAPTAHPSPQPNAQPRWPK